MLIYCVETLAELIDFSRSRCSWAFCRSEMQIAADRTPQRLCLCGSERPHQLALFQAQNKIIKYIAMLCTILFKKFLYFLLTINLERSFYYDESGRRGIRGLIHNSESFSLEWSSRGLLATFYAPQMAWWKKKWTPQATTCKWLSISARVCLRNLANFVRAGFLLQHAKVDCSLKKFKFYDQNGKKWNFVFPHFPIIFC